VANSGFDCLNPCLGQDPHLGGGDCKNMQWKNSERELV
jgi:hypothetical protein